MNLSDTKKFASMIHVVDEDVKREYTQVWTRVRTNLFWMSLRAFFAKQSHHWEIATPQGERLRLAMTGTWVLMSDFLSEGQRIQDIILQITS